MQKYSCVQSSELRQQRRVCCFCWAWWWCSSVYSRRPLLALAVIRRRIQEIINKIEVLFLWNIWRQCRQWCAYVCLYHCMFDAGAAAKCCWDCSVAWIDYKRPPPPAATTPQVLRPAKFTFVAVAVATPPQSAEPSNTVFHSLLQLWLSGSTRTA